MRKRLHPSLILIGVLATPLAHGQDEPIELGDGLAPPSAENQRETDIVETTVAAGTFGKLVAFVQASGLDEALAGAGPYTLFAPTDAAFDALPDGYVDQLMDPAMHDDLVKLLSYHVVPEALDSAALAKLVEGIGPQTATIPTVLEGLTLVIENQVGVTVDGAEIVRPDMKATNGFVHGIDTVLLPDAS